MDKTHALSLLWERNIRLNKLTHIEALIEWDRETGAPEKSGEEQAEMLELLTTYYYQEACDPVIQEAVKSVEEADFERSEDKAMVRFWKEYYKTEAVLGKEFVAKWALSVGLAESKWLEARKANDFAIFEPYLETLVSLAREKARIIDSTKPAYDVLLSLFEPDMSTAKIDSLFFKLAEVIHQLLEKVDAKIDDSFLTEDYDKKALHEFCIKVTEQMGFDSKRGIIDLSAHPFTTTLGVDDVRVTTRYTDKSLIDPIASLVHETGHALYDQNASLNPAIRGTTLAQGVSMGVHESQSRLWENFLAKSKAFWSYEYPSLQSAIPSLKEVSLEQFYQAINKAQISPIRVNADELTYSLHVILRYELEKKLIGGELEVKDLPKAWNQMSTFVLGYRPKDDLEGVLQDCHWAGGTFGYFPTYVLGNFYAAMFLEEMKKSFDVDKALSEGNFKLITDWQNEHIWAKGCIYKPSELLRKCTGKELGVNAFCEYLVSKYSKV